jgi:hypothetical protein
MGNERGQESTPRTYATLDLKDDFLIANALLGDCSVGDGLAGDRKTARFHEPRMRRGR